MTLLELYREAYPEHEFCEYFQFTTYFNLGICLTEADRYLYRQEEELARNILLEVIRERRNDRNI